jgi:phage terminase Nu1 subunit (DNA packaging protein)
MDERYIVNTSDLAEILGLTPRCVQQLANESKIPRLIDSETKHAIEGRWSLPDVVSAYVRLKVASAKGEDVTEQALKEEKLRKARADADIRELDRDFREGSLHRSEDVRAIMDAMNGAIRARALALPMKVARELISQRDIVRIAEILESAVSEFLAESKTFDKAEFLKFNKQFLADAAAQEIARPETTPEQEGDK